MPDAHEENEDATGRIAADAGRRRRGANTAKPRITQADAGAKVDGGADVANAGTSPFQSSARRRGSPLRLPHLEIFPNAIGGPSYDRYDVTVHGRVASRAPMEIIWLEHDGLTVSATEYAPDDHGTPAETPDGETVCLYSFQFNIAQPLVSLPGEWVFELIARDRAGDTAKAPLRLALESGSDQPVVMLKAPPAPAPQVDRGAPPGMLRLEVASIDRQGMLLVGGWAVAMAHVNAVQISLVSHQGIRPVGDAKLGWQRQDVAGAFPSYPDNLESGFTLLIQLDPRDQVAAAVQARLVCGNGFAIDAIIPIERIGAWTDTPLGGLLAHERRKSEPGAAPQSSAVPVVPAVFRMFCDEAVLGHDGSVSVNGWAVCDRGVAQVRIMVGDDTVGLATLGYERPDVGAAYAEVPSAALSGFKFKGRLDRPLEGEHRVRVVARDTQGQERVQDVAVTVVAPAVPQPPPAATPPASPELDAEFKFQLDLPVVQDGVVAEPITGRLTVEGWLLARHGVASFIVYLDDQRLGDAHYGQARHDVGAAFPDWPDSVRSGYAFHCPPRSLRDGDHTVRLEIIGQTGLKLERSFRVTVARSDDNIDTMSIRRKVARPETDLLAGLLNAQGYRPSYHLIVRQKGKADPAATRVTLLSLADQVYGDWTAAILAETAEIATAIEDLVATTVPELRQRFQILSPAAGEVWQAPLAQLAGETSGRPVLYGLLSAGDELGIDALLQFAVAGAMNRGADLLYADEVRLSPASQEQEPFFKPDYSPDLLLSMNYIGRPWFASAALLGSTGGTAASLAVAGEFNLLLRCVDKAAAIHHLPLLLCQRGMAATDGPELEQAALESAMARGGTPSEVRPGAVAGTWRVRRTQPATGKVSVIIPTCAAHGYIKTCLTTFRANTRYKNYELIVIDNIPASQSTWKEWIAQNADKVVDMPDAFNWSVFNNRAAAVADGDYLLFLNDDIEITQEDWLDVLLENAQRPEVGLTGPRLLYPDGKIQHAGMFLAENGIGRHAFRFAAPDEPGYFGLAQVQRNVMAVTGACMLVRRDLFNRLGGFDEEHQIVNNDLDFCLRVHKAGLLTVYTPHATLTHHELASRAGLKDVFNNEQFDSAWRTTFALGDPYFSPRLSRRSDDVCPDEEAVQWVTPGAPLFRVEDIRRILVVKLDHIGDFVTALPAIRRLKQSFPRARITVLAGPASKAFVPLEQSIDEFIPFAFFHARSQLGERELTKEDFEALAEQLRPYRFDLAIDLRKHPSTRDVLKYTGARFLAGYDYQGQFPNLDIALDWDGDRRLQRKRSHVIDDLIALVDAVHHATESDRVLMQPQPQPIPLADLPDDVRALFDKPVVAIHPGAGNVTKQWPTAYFLALIELLISRHGVNVLMVGGPDEVEVVEELLAAARYPKAMASMAGKSPLSSLPGLLLRCAVYIGNDSGPKHIAAAAGVPTIGIHSGVVDPVEWGPLGTQAIALRRNMTCAPCYLASAADCTRGLACLQHLDVNEVYRAALTLLQPVLALRGDAPPATEPVLAPPNGDQPAAARVPAGPPAEPSAGPPARPKVAKRRARGKPAP